MKLIDKDAFVAEIENLENTYKKCPHHSYYEEGLKEGRLIGYKDALNKINTLEVKEVDLEVSFDDYMTPYNRAAFINIDAAFELAKHFFELGLKAQKVE